MDAVSPEAEGALSDLYGEVLDVTNDPGFPEESVWQDVDEDVRQEVGRELPEVAGAAECYLAHLKMRDDHDTDISSYLEELKELPDGMVDLDGERPVFQAADIYHDVDELGERFGRLVTDSSSPMRLRFKLLSDPEIKEQGFQEFFEYWDDHQDGWAEKIHWLFHETGLISEYRGRDHNEKQVLSHAESFKDLMENEWSTKGYKAKQFAEIHGNTRVRKFLD